MMYDMQIQLSSKAANIILQYIYIMLHHKPKDTLTILIAIYRNLTESREQKFKRQASTVFEETIN